MGHVMSCKNVKKGKKSKDSFKPLLFFFYSRIYLSAPLSLLLLYIIRFSISSYTSHSILFLLLFHLFTLFSCGVSHDFFMQNRLAT